MRQLIAALVTIVAVGDSWRIDLMPHPDNTHVEVVTQCKAGESFLAFNTFEISSDQSVLTIRRVPVPRESHDCWIGVRVVRNAGDDPTKDYTGEYTIARME